MWVTSTTYAAACVRPFFIEFHSLVATDTAVIALGTDDGSIATLRKKIMNSLPAPPTQKDTLDLIHTTLFRYRGPLEEPRLFAEAVGNVSFKVAAKVDRIAIVKEIVYPSIESEVQLDVPLGEM